MAESVDDDTAVRGGEVETAVVPDLAPTQAAELAWSDADPPEPKVRKPLPRSLRWLLVVVAVGAVAAGAFVVGHQVAPSTSAPKTVTVTQSALATTSPTAAPPPIVGSTTRRPRARVDQAFLDKIHAAGLPFYGGDDAAIISAYSMCNAMSDRAHPMSVADLIGISQRSIPWTYEQSATFVREAVQSFCPWQWNPE